MRREARVVGHSYMGSSGDKPRKPRRHLRKVPRGEEGSNIQIGGLAEGDNSGAGPRLGHENASGRSYEIGKFQTFVLWCLGRRPKPLENEEEPSD
jgi:hypothetical protein